MRINESFSKKNIEIFRYNIKLENINKNIYIQLDSDTFEHFFLLVKDPDKKLRALLTYKTRKKEYYISKILGNTSNGTIYGDLLDGNWEFIVIKPYDITGDFSFEVKIDEPEEKSEYDLELLKQDFDKKYSEEKRWYKGDLHVHSTYSDGRQDFSSIFKVIKEKKFDFLFLTDHTVIPTLFYKSDICVVPSTEITFDNDGHINIFGIKELIDYSAFFKEVSFEDKNEIIDKILEFQKNKGSLISLNHPFHTETPFHHDVDLENVELIEIMNSPYYHEDFDYNGEAVKFLDFLWLTGYKIYGVGGSDSHKPLKDGTETVGIPMTFIYSCGLSPNELLKGMRKGNVYVSRKHPVNINILNGNKEVLPGEEIKGSIKYTVECEDVLKWNLVKNGKIIETKIGKKEEFNFDILDGEFYRVEGCELEENRVFVYINPIYNNVKFNKKGTWKQIMSKYFS